MSYENLLHEEKIFNQWKLWRSWVVELIDTIPEEHYDVIPAPFRNNIRWNAGHLLVGFDHIISSTLDIDRSLPEHYHVMFPRGSSPVDWKEEPPTMDEIKEHLKLQPQKSEEIVKGKLDTPLKQEFLGMKTLGEMVQFLTVHDGLHLSTMNAIRRILSNK